MIEIKNHDNKSRTEELSAKYSKPSTDPTSTNTLRDISVTLALIYDNSIESGITNEIHELNRTLKEILREMRKRKV